MLLHRLLSLLASGCGIDAGVARLNSVLCACKSQRCRRRWRERVRFDTATQLALGFSRNNQGYANEVIPRKDTYRRRNPAFPDYTARDSSGRCRCRSPALAARDGAPGAVEASRVQAHAGPRRPRNGVAPGASYRRSRPHTTLGQHRHRRAARAKDCHRADTPKGCRRADAHPGQPHAAAARRGTQQAA